jgi:hypothetical protein
MFKKKTKEVRTPIHIDIDGPDGNAYALLAYAESLSKQLGKNTDDIINRMMMDDYTNLLEVFNHEFGHIVVLETDNEELISIGNNESNITGKIKKD